MGFAERLQILALAEMHGREAVARAIDDGLELAAFSAEYIARYHYRKRSANPILAPTTVAC